MTPTAVQKRFGRNVAKEYFALKNHRLESGGSFSGSYKLLLLGGSLGYQFAGWSEQQAVQVEADYSTEHWA